MCDTLCPICVVLFDGANNVWSHLIREVVKSFAASYAWIVVVAVVVMADDSVIFLQNYLLVFFSIVVGKWICW